MTTVTLGQPVGGAPSPAPPTGDTRTCRECGHGIHAQHSDRCPDCHQARGLCSRCYRAAQLDGTLDRYPPIHRGEPTRRDCPHGGKHHHGTADAYIRDHCHCIPCRQAKNAFNRAWRIRAYTRGRDNIDATGTIRRVRALAALGWSLVEQGRVAGFDVTQMRRLCRGQKTVRRETADRVRALYDALSMRTPVESPSAGKTRAWAARNGWAKPLQWDDAVIDDPAAKPYTDDGPADELVDEMAVERFISGDHGMPLNHRERVEVTRRMLRAGARRNAVMAALKVNGSNFMRIRNEALTDMEAAA